MQYVYSHISLILPPPPKKKALYVQYTCIFYLSISTRLLAHPFSAHFCTFSVPFAPAHLPHPQPTSLALLYPLSPLPIHPPSLDLSLGPTSLSAYLRPFLCPLLSSSYRPVRLDLHESAWYHWIGLEKDINCCRF